MALRRKQYSLATVGADGTAVATQLWQPGRPGILRFIKIDYVSEPATTDIVIKRDSSSGATVLTRTSSLTDIGPIAVGTTAIDEARAATAATDALSGGIPFTSGLYIDIAQADEQTTGDERVNIDFYWEPCKKKNITLLSSNAGAGTSAATAQWTYGRPGVVRFLQMDFGAVSATCDFTIKRDDSSGATIFTSTDSATDFGPSAIGTASGDEAFAAGAATDGFDGGLVFNTGLYFATAQSDALITSTASIWFEA